MLSSSDESECSHDDLFQSQVKRTAARRGGGRGGARGGRVQWVAVEPVGMGRVEAQRRERQERQARRAERDAAGRSMGQDVEGTPLMGGGRDGVGGAGNM